MVYQPITPSNEIKVYTKICETCGAIASYTSHSKFDTNVVTVYCPNTHEIKISL